MRSRITVVLVVYFLTCTMALYGGARSQFDAHAAQHARDNPIKLTRQIPPNTSLIQIKDGGACVSLFAALGGGRELRARVEGRGRDKKTVFYFHGIEVQKFPRPAIVYFSLAAQCRNPAPSLGLSFSWPDFSKKLRFVLNWDLPTSSKDRIDAQLTMSDGNSSSWQEGNSLKELSASVPAEGIGLSTPLVVKVFTENRLLRTFELQMKLDAPINSKQK